MKKIIKIRTFQFTLKNRTREKMKNNSKLYLPQNPNRQKGMLPKTIAAALLILLISAVCFADNPLVSHVYTADPAARVFNGRVYVIATHDQDDQTGYSQLVDYYLFSSDDMVNWQDHGIVFNARTDTSWASLAYAPDWIYRNGKYYLYFPNGGGSIGVAVSDRPEGPYTDPLGTSLINQSMPNCNVEWCFDPCVFVDDDGQAYIYFGGGGPGNARVIQLNDDMISVKGAAITIDAPRFFEAAYMHKRNGIYYFSYSTDFSNGAATIDYMTSNNPTSGFQHRGTVLNNPWENNNNNNHQSILEYNGQWYIFYHNRAVANERGASTYQRSINADRMYYNSDGTIQLVNDSAAGVPQLKNVDAFTVNEAETIDNEWGIETQSCSEGTLNLTDLNSGDWVKISNVDFGSGADTFQARVAAWGSTSIEVILDNVSNQPIGTLEVSSTGGNQTWQTQSATIDQVTGVHDLYLYFNGSVNVNWYRFSLGGDGGDGGDDSGDDGTTSNNVLEVELESLSGQSNFQPFEVRSDSNASGGQYIVWPDEGDDILSTPSDSATGQIEIEFTLSQAADVQFQIRVDMPDWNDDSFYYRIDANSWVTQNNVATNGWETLSPDSFSLSAGAHTLTILRREDGAMLDKVTLTASTGEIISNQ
jgi:hypothetical protein